MLKKICIMLFTIALLLLMQQNAFSTNFNFYKGPAGKAIHFRLFENIIYIPVKINHSHDLHFILDTGAAGVTCIDEKKAKKFNFVFGQKNITNGAGDNTIITYSLGNAILSLPGIEFPDLELTTMPLKKLIPYWGLKIEGILGGNALEQVVTEINYANNAIRFYDPGNFHYNGTGERIPISIYSKSPYVKAKISVDGIKEPIEGLFLIDTGLRGMIFTVPFHEKYGLAQRSSRVVHNTLGFGIGGESRGIIGRIKSFSIGGNTFNNPVVGFSSDKQGVLAQNFLAGVVGTSFLDRFRIFLNYKKKEMILEKNKYFPEPFEYDMSGIYFIYGDEHLDRIIIYNIIQNSPAAEAGLKKGDIIESINNRKSSSFTKDEIMRIFIGAGKKVRLIIQRNGHTFATILVLRRLI